MCYRLIPIEITAPATQTTATVANTAPASPLPSITAPISGPPNPAKAWANLLVHPRLLCTEQPRLDTNYWRRPDGAAVASAAHLSGSM